MRERKSSLSRLLSPEKRHPESRKKYQYFIISIVFVFSFLYLSQSTHSNITIFKNVNLYRNRSVNSFAVSDGKFIGFNKVYKNAKIVDLKNSFITPGFIDSHGHSYYLGIEKSQCSLISSSSIYEIIKRLESCSTNTRSNFLFGLGWDQNLWVNKTLPSYKDLSSPKLDNFNIILTRVDYHAYWINNKFLQTLKLPIDFKVDGGTIILDESNNPTGIFIDNAMQLIDSMKPVSTDQEYLDALVLASNELTKYGITTINDAGLPPHLINLMKQAIDKDLFKPRNYIMINCPNQTEICESKVDPILLFNKNGGKLYKDKLLVKSVKLLLDGAIGSYGAKFFEPYSDAPLKTGFLRIPASRVNEIVFKWAKLGYQVNQHAIGDMANNIALNAIEHSIKHLTLNNNHRFRIEHAQVIKDTDVSRFKELNVIASIQPTHATTDMKYALSRLGDARLQNAYLTCTFKKIGVGIALGSDFPVENSNPLFGIYSAVTRLDHHGDSPDGKDGWYQKEKIGFDDAFDGFTSDASFASFSENIVGKVDVGYFADFVVWDRDFTRDVADLLRAKAVTTFIGGTVVYQKD